MNYKKLIPIISVALLLPMVATASVIISSNYTVASSPVSHGLYLEYGPNYKTANASGFVYAKETGQNISSGSSIYVNYTPYVGTVYLLNVLELKDVGVTGVLYINGSLPSSDISMYVSNNNESYLSGSGPFTVVNATETSGESSYTLGTSINLAPGHTYYISFVISVGGSQSLSSSTTNIYMNYYYD